VRAFNQIGFARGLVAAGCLALAARAAGQPEAQPWGGLRGIRIDGELIAFTTGLRAVPANVEPLGRIDLERLAAPRFRHDGAKQIIDGSVAIGPLSPPPPGGLGRASTPPNTEIVYEDTGPGTVRVTVQVTPSADAELAGIFYYVHLPATEFANAAINLLETTASPGGGAAPGMRIVSAHRQLEIAFARPVKITTGRGRRAGGLDLCFPIAPGNVTADRAARFSFTLKAGGDIDRTPVTIALDPSSPGSAFDGIGGNFRIQNRQLDPPQVDYNLNHLRVVWSRANVPLNLWQPNESLDPVAEAKAGRLNDNVRVAMEMARTLAQRKIPLVLTVWTAPAWALGPLTDRPRGGGGGQTRHVNPEKWDALCRSIGGYLDYVKENFGAEPRYFSFNETDIGYDILQTPPEHAEAIKRLGSYFAAHGIGAKLLLGDTGDPTGINFIDAAMGDPDAVRYIGAVSYHSWRGGTAEQFTRWGAAAKKLGVPLLIGEGGMDADAYRYQALLLEPWYALAEIGEYIDICRWSQPLSILQWQLTENYSLLTGGRNDEPLKPAQRFWQLAQLGATPAGALAVPISCDRPNLAVCAYQQRGGGGTVVHIVNTGAARQATITGLPGGVKRLRVVVTDAHRGLTEPGRIDVAGGAARVALEPMSYTSLFSVE
jgi:hypothetical protein